MSKKSLPKVAYFCMEYGLSTDIKIYAGGLGILASKVQKTEVIPSSVLVLNGSKVMGIK